ncbi:MAG: toxin-antitoxin system YwqK family antitoxin [Chitinophagales bacterium]
MRIIFCFLLLVSMNSFAQWKDYSIGVRGDTLNRVDLKGKKQGPWSIHVDDLRGEKGYEEEGYFENDVKEGTWKRYSLQGIKIAEENYRWGKLNGRSKYFTYNGGLLRSESWRAMDPANAFDTVEVFDVIDPTKVVKRVVIKNEGIALKHGEWSYYDPVEGVIVKTENYQLDKLVNNQGEAFDDELKPLGVGGYSKSDTTGKKTLTKPQAVIDYEKKNSGKKKVKTRDGRTGY